MNYLRADGRGSLGWTGGEPPRSGKWHLLPEEGMHGRNASISGIQICILGENRISFFKTFISNLAVTINTVMKHVFGLTQCLAPGR